MAGSDGSPPCFPTFASISSRLLTRGNGAAGTGTPRNEHNGCQPSFGEKTSSRSGGSASMTCLVAALEPVGHERSILHAAVEGIENDAVHHGLDRRTGKRALHLLGKDGFADRIEPSLGVAHGENHLGVGVEVGELAPVGAGGVIRRGRIAVEDCVPVRLALHGLQPERNVAPRAGEDFGHVVARPEADVLERELQ